MIKILFVIDGLRKGGKERRFLQLITNLATNVNVDMKIVLFHHDIDYEIDEEIRSKLVFVNKNSKKSISPFFQIYRIAKLYNPDIVHTWSSMVTTYSLPAIIILKKRLINSQISDAPEGFSYISVFGINCWINFWFSDRILSNSKAGLEAYQLLNNRKCNVIYNGFDFKRINKLSSRLIIQKKFNLETKFTVGMVASFSEKKDYRTYILAAREILSIRDDVTFLCVGSGDSLKYEILAGEYLQSKIVFTGPLINVEEIMSVCDIGVLSTYGEGISNALLEFSALGKPVIASNKGGCKELIINQISGYLVDSTNFIELSNTIHSLLNDSDLRIKVGTKAREVVKQKFSINEMVNSFIEEYKCEL